MRSWQQVWPKVMWILVILGLMLAGLAAWIALNGKQWSSTVYDL